MSSLTIARRYARALSEEATREAHIDAVDQDIDLIRDALDASHDLVRFFESPVISRQKKEAVVKTLFAERVQQTTLNFLRLLIEKKREALFPDVVRAYRLLRDAQEGILEARARLAHVLSEDEEKTLRQALERLTGKRIRLSATQDPTLIGGLVVRVGDTVYDGSVRHQLASLRERMGAGVPTNGA